MFPGAAPRPLQCSKAENARGAFTCHAVFMRQKLSTAGSSQEVAGKSPFTGVVSGRTHAIAKVLRCPGQGASSRRGPAS